MWDQIIILEVALKATLNEINFGEVGVTQIKATFQQKSEV